MTRGVDVVRRALVAAVTVGLMIGLIGAPPAGAARTCTPDDEPIRVGIAEAKGCYSTVTIDGVNGYRFSEKFQLNGWTVTPNGTSSVVFVPTVGKRQGVIRTDGGTVALSATNAKFGTLNFRSISFNEAPPNQGQMTLAESALAQPFPILFSLTPLGVSQPIVLESGGQSSVELTFDLGGLLGQWLAKTEKKLGFSLSYAIANGAFTVEGGSGSVKDFEILKELFTVNELTIAVDSNSIRATFEGSFKLPRNGLSIGGTVGFERDTGIPVEIGFKSDGANVQMGTTPIYWQGLGFDFKWPPPPRPGVPAPPFYGEGEISFSAGRKEKFLGRDVAPVEWSNIARVASRDEVKKLPGYFGLYGRARIFGLDIADADFTYYFGVGAQFGLRMGIGFPSGRNDPGQPNYVGGGFRGAIWNEGFNLEGSGQLKLVGVQMAAAEMIISNFGIAGCFKFGLAVGGGIRWSDGKGQAFAGLTCDIGQYRRRMPAGGAFPRAGADTDETPVTLVGRDRVVKVVAAPGEDEAPHVVLEGDDGESIRSPHPDDEDGLVTREDGRAISDDDRTTLFILPPGSEGDWSLRELPGSSEVADVYVARATRDPEIDARVTGNPRRARRTLTWNATDRRHQTLLFTERLPNGKEVVIRKTRKASGKVRFTPTQVPGSFGERELKVRVMQRLNTPRDEQRLGRFVVSRPPRPGGIRAMSAHRHSDRVSVKWSKARNARSYEVKAKVVGFPLIHREVVRGRKARLDVEAIAPLRVTVTPLGRLDRRGPGVSTRIRAKAGMP